jgi:Uma2 family endonuclease
MRAAIQSPLLQSTAPAAVRDGPLTWPQVCAHPALQDLPFKIELNKYGKIEMSPASNWHGIYQADLITFLKARLGGRAAPELAIDTSEGQRVPDVSWAAQPYWQDHFEETSASVAPPLCIEIVSASNSLEEMRIKIAAYIESGAIEVWLVGKDRSVRFFAAQGEIGASSFGGITKEDVATALPQVASARSGPR